MFESLRFALPVTASLFLASGALAQSRATDLPDGAGKELVQRACVSCHPATLITTSTGYTHATKEQCRQCAR